MVFYFARVQSVALKSQAEIRPMLCFCDMMHTSSLPPDGAQLFANESYLHRDAELLLALKFSVTLSWDQALQCVA